MLAAIEEGKGARARPAAWAPFVTVGEGGVPIYLKLHFAPGECAQIDWGVFGTVAVGNSTAT